MVNTARIGIAKPDPRVYRIAAERVGATTERCLFVDDIAANVTAARETGMTGLHYRRIDDLRTVLPPAWTLAAHGPAPCTGLRKRSSAALGGVQISLVRTPAMEVYVSSTPEGLWRRCRSSRIAPRRRASWMSARQAFADAAIRGP
ncbi:HAD-IA family hydrolase [Streptomyces sp. SAS_267]|uniref:HAD-IA family hydrolase n=1 Tax=unclassified Streptomyces TaxID=2593676 RepID=UPI0036F69DB9